MTEHAEWPTPTTDVDKAIPLAAEMCAWILRKRLDRVSKRNIDNHSVWRYQHGDEAMFQALGELERVAWIRRVVDMWAAPRWDVNPQVHSLFAAGAVVVPHKPFLSRDGRPTKYPFAQMQVGEFHNFPSKDTTANNPDYAAAKNFEARYPGTKFIGYRASNGGINIKRIA